MRAVRAAAEMREALRALNEELERTWGIALQTRTGVNTGEVFAGDRRRGAGARSLGDAVNVAARLEQAAEPGEILLGEATYRLVRDAVVAEPRRAARSSRARPEPVAAWRCSRSCPARAGWSAPARLAARRPRPRARAPRAAFDRVDGSGRARSSRHRPGRRRQVAPDAEFVARLGDRATVVEGRCLPYGEGITFWPIAAVAQGRGRHRRARPAEEARRKISALLGADEDAALVAERLAPLLGVGPEPRRRSRRRSGRCASCSSTSARERPLVVVFDDIQWGEPTFLDLLEYLADWIARRAGAAGLPRAAGAARGRPGLDDREGERDA